MAGNTLLRLLTMSSSTSKGEESFRRRLSLRSSLLILCGSHTVPHLVSHTGAVRPMLLCELQELC